MTTKYDKVNHFPHCSTFEKDKISDHFYCVDCGADERNVEEYWSNEDVRDYKKGE